MREKEQVTLSTPFLCCCFFLKTVSEIFCMCVFNGRRGVSLSGLYLMDSSWQAELKQWRKRGSQVRAEAFKSKWDSVCRLLLDIVKLDFHYMNICSVSYSLLLKLEQWISSEPNQPTEPNCTNAKSNTIASFFVA